MIHQSTIDRYYPPQLDGTLRFYGWIRENLHPSMEILNLGAGPPTNSPKRVLRGEVKHVTGADIDPCVLTNPELDSAAVITDGRLPFPDHSFDAAVSDFVFEHVDDPMSFLAEAHRVLRPGAPLFFRTPNKYHYVTTVSRLTPHWVHKAIANRVRGLPDETHEPWPTRYLLNTPSQINRHARAAGFEQCEYQLIESEPSYLVFSRPSFYAGVIYERLVNHFHALARFRSCIIGKLVARPHEH